MMTPAKAFDQYIDLCGQFGAPGASPLLQEINGLGRSMLAEAAKAYRPDPAEIDTLRPDAMFAPDYGINLMRVGMPVDPAATFRCGVPNLGSLLTIVANDSFHPTEALLRNMPEGLTVCSLNKVPDGLQHVASQVMRETLEGGGVAEALNAAFLADGVFIHAAAGVKVDKAIQIVNISAPTVPMLSLRRVVIVAEEGASLRVLLCDHSQTAATPHLNSQLVSVRVAENAAVELYDIEEDTPATNRHWTLDARQQSHSSLTVNSTCLHGGLSANRYNINVEGDYAETSLSGLAICGGEQTAANTVTLTHSGKHCTSRQLFKNALFDNSRGGFGGKIIVRPGAMFTDAEQTNRNLLADDNARMTAAPQLEIYCDEVKCSHGATTGQLDERALFYMQTRGIPAAEARTMLTQAFMVDVIDNISFEVLRQRIHVLVEKRLTGAAASCDTCATACHTS